MSMLEEKAKRNVYIDILKVLGLFCIIIAHVNPPGFINQIRSFDVPLMVFVSGMLAVNSYNKTKNSFQYVIKRLERLLIPTWIFLSFYFIVRFFFGSLPDWKIILKSYLLQHDSIGYVWIIWIYLMCAIITPLVSKIDLKNRLHIIDIIILYLLFEVFCYFKIGFEIRVIYTTFYFVIPYGIVFLLGFYYRNFTKKQKVVLFMLFLFSYVILGIVYSYNWGGVYNDSEF